MMIPFEWVVGDSSKDHTVTALTSGTTSRATMRYTTMRDSTAQFPNKSSDIVHVRENDQSRLRQQFPIVVARTMPQPVVLSWEGHRPGRWVAQSFEEGAPGTSTARPGI